MEIFYAIKGQSYTCICCNIYGYIYGYNISQTHLFMMWNYFKDILIIINFIKKYFRLN